MTSPVTDTAYDVLVQMLREWGLDSLAPDVLRMLQEGRTVDQISLLLQDTEAYKTRFAGNEVRRQKGMPVLSPREYLATESAYRQIMESAGLPPGFYDQPDDFANWIGSDVSPSEIRSRVDEAQAALDLYDENNPGAVFAFKSFYNINREDLVAHVLDRERWDINQLQRAGRAARIGASGYREGLTFGRERAEQLALSGIVPTAQLGQAVGQVGELTRELSRLSGFYTGDDYGQLEAEEEVFFGDSQAKRKRRELVSREVGEFSGGSGVGRSSLAQPAASY